MGEIGRVFFEGEGEGEGELWEPDGGSLVGLLGLEGLRLEGLRLLYCRCFGEAALGTAAGPRPEALTRASPEAPGFVTAVCNAPLDIPQLCASGMGKTLTHASLSASFRRLCALLPSPVCVFFLCLCVLCKVGGRERKEVEKKEKEKGKEEKKREDRKRRREEG